MANNRMRHKMISSSKGRQRGGKRARKERVEEQRTRNDRRRKRSLFSPLSFFFSSHRQGAQRRSHVERRVRKKEQTEVKGKVAKNAKKTTKEEPRSREEKEPNETRRDDCYYTTFPSSIGPSLLSCRASSGSPTLPSLFSPALDPLSDPRA